MMPRSEIAPVYLAGIRTSFPSVTKHRELRYAKLERWIATGRGECGGNTKNIQPGIDGLLTDDNPNDFADRILFLMDNELELKEMGGHARTNAPHYSIRKNGG